MRGEISPERMKLIQIYKRPTHSLKPVPHLHENCVETEQARVSANPELFVSLKKKQDSIARVWRTEN